MLSSSWCPQSCVIPSSLTLGWPSDLLLANRIQEAWERIIRKIMTYILLADSLLPSLLTWSNDRLPCWRGSCDKQLTLAEGQEPSKNWGPLSDNLWVTEFGQQPPIQSLSWLLWLQPVRKIYTGPSQIMPGFMTHHHCDIIKVCCFKQLNFLIICDMLIYN